jgi:hypothetical protein
MTSGEHVIELPPAPATIPSPPPSGAIRDLFSVEDTAETAPPTSSDLDAVE